MRKIMIGAAALLAAVCLTGCASSYPRGVIITQLKLPVSIGEALVKQNMKVGVAECKSYVGVVAMGDASVATAARNGGISKIYFVDWDVENILGLIGTYRCTVYGE
jgi:hypothetical protein